MKKLLWGVNGSFKTKDVLILDFEGIKSVTHPLRLEILKELSKKPDYPNEIAKRLKIHEQKIYYHMQKMKDAGIIKVVDEKEIKGALARFYAPSAQAFGLELPFGEKNFIPKRFEANPLVESFFGPFINNGVFDGLMVVGNPWPHGPHKAGARDGHYGIYLGLFLGRICSIPEDFNVRLDSDVIAENRLGENMILIGGPGANLVTARINKNLPIRFFENKASPEGKVFYGSITDGSSTFSEDSCGLIARIKNPFNPQKTIIILAGLRVVGTKACVLGLTKHYEQILKGFEGDGFARVIQGFDLDGDGKLDSVEVLK